MTEEQARERVAQGCSIKQVAAEAGVSYMTAYRWVKPGYRHGENERAKSKPRVRRVTPTERLNREIVELRTGLANTKAALDASRRRAARYKRERDRLAAELREAKPFTLTELHEWWLATKSPEEIVRIASGLWEEAA